MDELLSFMEEGCEDEVRSSSEPTSGGTSSTSQSQRSNSPLKHHNSTKKDKKNLSFNDVFGSPDKRDVVEFFGTRVDKKVDFDKAMASSALNLNSDFRLSKSIRNDKNVPYKPDTTQVVIDPYSRIRLVTKSIQIYFDESMTAEAVLKDRNIGLEFVSLSTFNGWYKNKGNVDKKNFWVSGVLVKKTPGVRKSAKGNDYCIWEICDLRDLDKKFTVFLFGSASSSSISGATPVGSVVDVTSPSVMPDTSNNGQIKFSVNNSTQIRHIATSKDFGFCQATRKDGNKCTAVVNTWECSFCIHHASGELKKLNIGLKKGSSSKGGRAKGGLLPNKSFSAGGSQEEDLRGVMISNFGVGGGNSQSFIAQKASTPAAPSSKIPAALLSTGRMALQGSAVEMKKNSIKFGNPDTVTFIKNDKEHKLLVNDPVPVAPPRKPLNLCPTKTRHLTERDRELLQMLETKTKPDAKKETETKSSKSTPSNSAVGNVSNIITSAIVTNPNAATRNFMQFLQLQHAPKDQVDLTSSHKSSEIQPLVMSREKVKSMQKALAFVKHNGPIKKTDPNAVVTGKKRKFSEISDPSKSQQGPSSSKKRSSKNIDVEFDFESDEFKKILNAKSAHDDELDGIQHEEYFGKLEKKEALENKLLNTFSIETNAVMCRQCKYVALGQSDFCKEQMHEARVVKARKRFFKCKDCGNRTMSLDRLPKRPCSNCNNSSWLVAPVGKERKGPTLPSEMLAVRGHEEKFVGSAGSKMYLHLEV